jgi:hypothetical protein
MHRSLPQTADTMMAACFKHTFSGSLTSRRYIHIDSRRYIHIDSRGYIHIDSRGYIHVGSRHIDSRRYIHIDSTRNFAATNLVEYIH